MAKANMWTRQSLIVLTASLAIALGTELVSWGTTSCQVPNPSTKFCTDSQTILGCVGTDSSSCGGLVAFERNQFPDGSVGSSSGTTTEDEADCHRMKVCHWDPDAKKCVANTDFNPWQPEDKTVADTVACPTTEG